MAHRCIISAIWHLPCFIPYVLLSQTTTSVINFSFVYILSVQMDHTLPEAPIISGTLLNTCLIKVFKHLCDLDWCAFSFTFPHSLTSSLSRFLQNFCFTTSTAATPSTYNALATLLWLMPMPTYSALPVFRLKATPKHPSWGRASYLSSYSLLWIPLFTVQLAR